MAVPIATMRCGDYSLWILLLLLLLTNSTFWRKQRRRHTISVDVCICSCRRMEILLQLYGLSSRCYGDCRVWDNLGVRLSCTLSVECWTRSSPLALRTYWQAYLQFLWHTVINHRQRPLKRRRLSSQPTYNAIFSSLRLIIVATDIVDTHYGCQRFNKFCHGSTAMLSFSVARHMSLGTTWNTLRS
jgi:hypothetical protein